LHPALAVIFACVPRCLTRPVVINWPPGSLSRVAFEMNCRKAPVPFITWRSNERAKFMFLGCPTVSPRPPNAADGATVVSTQNDKVAHCFLASHKRERRNEQSVRLAKGSEIEERLCC
jgi:hypothetical protein